MVVEVVVVGARQGAEAARRRRKRDVSSENITHRIEPWQSEGLSEMVPHGTETVGEGGVREERGREMEWDSLPA